jgi:hypothetical protein
MNRDEIIKVLERERDRLNEAIAALGTHRKHKSGSGNGRRRNLTPQDRKRISDGMRKSWARRKKK